MNCSGYNQKKIHDIHINTSFAIHKTLDLKKKLSSGGAYKPRRIISPPKKDILNGLDDKQKEFIEFVLSKYIESGEEVLDQEKLPSLLELKYFALSDAIETLGSVNIVKQNFISFQKYLYSNYVA